MYQSVTKCANKKFNSLSGLMRAMFSASVLCLSLTSHQVLAISERLQTDRVPEAARLAQADSAYVEAP